MKECQIRFTTQEKFAILREIELLGLEPVLKKYKLNVEALVQWQRKFRGTKTGSSIQFIKAKHGKEKNYKTKYVKRSA
jgi:hypothetical protein